MMTPDMERWNYRPAHFGSMEKCDNCQKAEPFRERRMCHVVRHEVPKNRVCDGFVRRIF